MWVCLTELNLFVRVVCCESDCCVFVVVDNHASYRLVLSLSRCFSLDACSRGSNAYGAKRHENAWFGSCTITVWAVVNVSCECNERMQLYSAASSSCPQDEEKTVYTWFDCRQYELLDFDSLTLSLSRCCGLTHNHKTE